MTELAHNKSVLEIIFLLKKIEGSRLATQNIWTQCRERLGVDEFRQTLGEYFTAKNVVVAEIVKGSTHMLVVQPPDDRAGSQMYLNRNGTFVYPSAPTTDDANVLGKVLTMIQGGALKLE